MDKSVAQKLMIVISMLTAMFATVFVCGSIVSSSVSTDSYIQPVPKIHAAVSFSDTSIDETPTNNVVSHSDADLPSEESAPQSTTTTTKALTNIENGVTVVEFMDDEDEDYTSETIHVEEEDIDNQFLYMTTVTTKLPDATVREALTTTTVKRTTTTTTRRTTKPTMAVNSAKPFAPKSVTTTRITTTKQKTTTSTTVKKAATTSKQPQTSAPVTTTTITTTTTTASTTTTAAATTTAVSTIKTTTAAPTTTTTTAAPTTTTTTAAPTTTTTKAPQIGGAASINKRTTTEPNNDGGQP